MENNKKVEFLDLVRKSLSSFAIDGETEAMLKIMSLDIAKEHESVSIKAETEPRKMMNLDKFLSLHLIVLR